MCNVQVEGGWLSVQSMGEMGKDFCPNFLIDFWLSLSEPPSVARTPEPTSSPDNQCEEAAASEDIIEFASGGEDDPVLGEFNSHSHLLMMTS